AVIGGIVYTILDQRLTALAGSEAIAGLPDVLRIPLSEPLFILGTLFILVVLFLPGGITGVALRLSRGNGGVVKDRQCLEERERPTDCTRSGGGRATARPPPRCAPQSTTEGSKSPTENSTTAPPLSRTASSPAGTGSATASPRSLATAPT